MAHSKGSPRTHVGRVRSGNEDCFLSDDALGLWLVADGMGGHEAGEVASEIVANTIASTVRDGIDLEKAIQFSHQAVLDGGHHGQGARGMGSTVVGLKQVENNHWQVAWVGDSRAYLWTRISDHEGELQQISRDHSYVQALVDAGAITEAEADNHPDKNVITQCLGSLEIPSVKVDIVSQEWKPHQKIILCSDGLSDEVSDIQIAKILNDNPDSNAAVQAMIDAALENGGRDNVTVVVIDSPISVEQKSTNSKQILKLATIILSSLAAAALAGLLINYLG
jgi:serine/threonine protein phosphatase PrpC